MKRTITNLAFILILNPLITPGMINAQDISLPSPSRKGGMPLMEALDTRSSARLFSEKELSLQQLSDLLWAAWGINREADSKRTAPSSHNRQEMEVYVALRSGLYLYDAIACRLKQIHDRDIRALTGTQDFPASAPVNLVYVADLARRGLKEGQQVTDTDLLSSWANTGFMAQNVYLWCASEEMSCVIRAMVPRDKLAPEMGLKPLQVIILAQTVGFPGE
ncbi:MAG: SagB/ThcOx family dehydrogenase [Bacteroidales bacterium]|nr:SagB/ThcOx family dehydrogenase [Bacteroidales bacterium]